MLCQRTNKFNVVICVSVAVHTPTKNEGYSQRFSDVLAMLDEVAGHAKNLFARSNMAFEFSRVPVSVLLAEKPCPTVAEAVNEGHRWHLQVGTFLVSPFTEKQNEKEKRNPSA